MVTHAEKKKRRWLLFLFLIPYFVLCWPPFYNFREPIVAGLPFFYWFQMLWIIITSVITATVYFIRE